MTEEQAVLARKCVRCNNNEDLARYLMLAFNEASDVFGDMEKKTIRKTRELTTMYSDKAS